MTEPPSQLKVTRSRIGYIYAIACGVLGLLAAWDAFNRGYTAVGLSTLVLTAAVVWFIALLFILPGLKISDSAVHVRNVFVDIALPWNRLRAVRAAMFLELEPDQGAPVRVWAAPQSAMKARRDQLARRSRDELDTTPLDARRGNLADALEVERGRALKAGTSSTGPVVRTVLWRDWGILAVLVVAGIVCLLFV